MPFFTRAEVNQHISKSGKNIGSKTHSVPTSVRKATTFLEDEYLKEILAASDGSYFYFKSLCHHSFRKNDPSHNLNVEFVRRFVFLNPEFHMCQPRSLYLAQRRTSRRFLRWAVFSSQAAVGVQSGRFFFLEKVLTSQILKEYHLPWHKSVRWSSDLKCSEQTFVRSVMTKPLPSSRRIACIHSFLSKGALGKLKKETFSPDNDV